MIRLGSFLEIKLVGFAELILRFIIFLELIKKAPPEKIMAKSVA